MAKHSTAYIGLGSNTGDRSEHISSVVKILAEAEQLQVKGVSDLLDTASPAPATQGEYLNAVAEISTTLTPQALLKMLTDIESSFGRPQSEKQASRKIDLDLLLFGTEAINLPDLTIPHPQMHLLSFVLKGLCQLAPDLLHPVIKEPVSELAARLNGCDFVLNPDLPQIVSVAGIIGVGKTTLARKLSNLLSGELLLEPYETNPFLPDVYAGRKELALDSQLYFLAGRNEQLNSSTLTPGQLVITDYIFKKELIFARRLLDTQQLSLYERIYDSIAANIPCPVLAIYLQDSPGKCLERIHRRNRHYEQQVEADFLGAIGADYDRLFDDWKICPIIRLSASELDYTEDAGFNHLANQIKCYIAAQRTKLTANHNPAQKV